MNPFKRMRRAWNLSRAHGRGVFNSTLSSVGSIFGMGGYTATDPRRPVLGQVRPSAATANQLLTASLSGLRSFSRHVERNNPTARAAVEALVANVVGTGIALEPDTGDEAIDKRLSAAWNDFIQDCCINGEHDIYWLQGQAMREVVVAGEFIWRLVVDTGLLDEGKIPLSVLPLEAEWLHQNANSMGQKDANGITWVNGVGINTYGKPVAYRLSNPEMIGTEYQEFKANEIIHGFERRRPLQSRGEPWFAPTLEVLQQERDLVDTELKAANNTASIAVAITSEYHDEPDDETNGSTDDPAHSLKMGGVYRLFPGENVATIKNDRPSQQIAPFRDMLRGDIAAALRVPQRFLDRNVSRANYSSMRCDMLDNDRLLAPVREWFGHATIGRLYKAALPYLALKAGIKVPAAKYKLLPDGQPYIDPQKDIAGVKDAISAGLSTHETEIAKRGGDYKKVWQQLAKEQAEKKSIGIEISVSDVPAQAQPAENQQGQTE